MNRPILVTGPAGNTGQVIIGELQRLKVPFVAMTHSKQRQQELLDRKIQARVGNYDKPQSLERALDGIKTAYLVCTPDERLVHREVNFIDAAKKAGVCHIVKCSAHLTDINSQSPNLRYHAITERILKDSGMNYTIIRPHGYYQTFLLFCWDMIRKAGVISLPGGDGKMALVDVRDVAQVAVKALLEPEQHAGKTYTITGLAAMSYADQAEVLTSALGKEVIYIPSSDSQFRRVAALLGVAGAPAEHVFQIFEWQREHKLDEIYPTLRELHIPCTPYERFVEDWIAGRTGGGNSFEESNSLRVRALNGFFNSAMYVRHELQRLLR